MLTKLGLEKGEAQPDVFGSQVAVFHLGSVKADKAWPFVGYIADLEYNEHATVEDFESSSPKFPSLPTPGLPRTFSAPLHSLEELELAVADLSSEAVSTAPHLSCPK